jgi:hypothetical protein
MRDPIGTVTRPKSNTESELSVEMLRVTVAMPRNAPSNVSSRIVSEIVRSPAAAALCASATRSIVLPW